MFDDRVYKRGALILHALRTELGDEAFFGMLREWVATSRYAGVTTPMFVEHVERWAGRSMDAVFGPWLFSRPVPRAAIGCGGVGRREAAPLTQRGRSAVVGPARPRGQPRLHAALTVAAADAADCTHEAIPIPS